MLIWGRVKLFDAKKGYGFLVAEDGKGDIFLHVKELRTFGVPSVTAGTRVQVRVTTTARGRQAAEVLAIEPPAPEPPPYAAPLEAAYVKWFDRAKGYGFVRVYGRGEDVYLHMETLRKYGFAQVEQGDTLAVSVIDGPRGPTVYEVRDWDHAIRPRGRRRAPRRPIVFPDIPTGPAAPDDLNVNAAVAGILRAGPRDRPRRRAPEIEALFIRGDRRHVDMILAWMFRAE
jgi:CspA family cold shock protein